MQLFFIIYFFYLKATCCGPASCLGSTLLSHNDCWDRLQQTPDTRNRNQSGNDSWINEWILENSSLRNTSERVKNKNFLYILIWCTCFCARLCWVFSANLHVGSLSDRQRTLFMTLLKGSSCGWVSHCLGSEIDPLLFTEGRDSIM